MATYEQKNVRSLYPHEVTTFAGNPSQLDEYQSRVLPRFIHLVDTNLDANCNDMAILLEEHAKLMQLKTMLLGRCVTGLKEGGFKHMAGILVDLSTNRPLVVLDAIGMAFGGQKNAEAGAYYRWPPRDWSVTKSQHYGGQPGYSEWWRSGAYTNPGRGKNRARGTPF